MKLVYFAWVRERIGKPEEDIALPAELVTVGDVIGWLTTRDEGYAYAFEDAPTIRAAIDQELVPHETAIAGARELAFFPPMTGG